MSHRQYSIQTSDIEKLNVRLLSISFSKDEKDWPSVLHTHHFTELFFVAGGGGNFLFRDKSYPIKTGDLIIVPPYLEHTEQSALNHPLQYYVIGIDGIIFQPETGESSGVQFFCNFPNQDLIAGLFAQILYEVRSQSYGSDKICHLQKRNAAAVRREAVTDPRPLAASHPRAVSLTVRPARRTGHIILCRIRKNLKFIIKVHRLLDPHTTTSRGRTPIAFVYVPICAKEHLFDKSII